MADTVYLKDALPDLMSTQVLAVDVYATFMKCSKGHELELWLDMLQQELAHVRFIGMLLDSEEVPDVQLPGVKLDAFRDLCERARNYARESAFERTLWALRLEHAQIDFGVEALAIKSIGEAPGTPVYPQSVDEHYDKLLEWAERYRGAREVASQIARIEEHIPGSHHRNGNV
jgi:hypothetical protein